MNLFIVLFRYTKTGEKSAGPVQQFRLYARDIRQAWEMARRHATYPGINLLDVVPA